MTERFVILAAQRTGSYMLSTALGAIDDVTCYGELFRKQDKGIDEDLAILGELDPVYQSFEYRRQNYGEFLEAIYSGSNAGLTGFKLMLRQAPALQEALMGSSEYRKIILDRANVLAQYSSHLIARSTGIGFVRKGEKPESPKVEFDVKDFNRFWRRYRNKYEELSVPINDSNRDLVLKIEYLELLRGRAFEQALDFLGLKADTDFTALIGTQKRNSSDILQRFSNPDRLVDYLRSIDKLEWCEEA